MIDVKVSEPRILITCDIHNEENLCIEVLDVLFSYGVEARCSWFQDKGLVVVYVDENLDAATIARYVASRNIRGYWIVPIDLVCPTGYEYITRCVIDAVLLKGYRLPIRILGRCRKRGNFVDSCSSLLRYVGNAVEDLGIAVVDFRGYEYVIRIEIVYESTFISIYSRNDEDAFRVKRLKLSG